ncbi:MAG TPA: CHAD domain-containing protein [Macromonas sp.]|nr:CHAD domain-containing protein [Macromonas sp.]
MSSEIELKLLLPGADPAHIARLLGQCPALAQAQPSQQWLRNRYYDTPEQLLRQQRAALRLRQISPRPWHTKRAPPTGHPQSGDTWWQTLKTAGVSHGGLSQRGEWECAVASGELDADALRATPWAAMDPEGLLFAQLQTCFETRCQRTTWRVQPVAGSEIEVALDIGEIAAAGQVQPMLELELELLAGPPQALFDLARQLGQHVALLPCDVSKAERGYALAQGQANVPACARASHLDANDPPLQVAATVMSEVFDQLTRNLAGLLQADDPELAHQARVAWRRWRSACRLFRPWLPAVPPRQPLRPLFEALGQLRDLDVARLDTLPRWGALFAQDDAQRQAMVATTQAPLAAATEQQRQQVRHRLHAPESGLAWLEHTVWLHQLHTLAAQAQPGHRHWAQQRINKLKRRLHQALRAAQTPSATPQLWHQARLQAKHTRYSLETLNELLPKQRTQRWLREATVLQHRLGQWRDAGQAASLLASNGAAPEWVAFMQGVAAALQPEAP